MAYVDHISVDGVQYDIRDAEAVSFEQEQTLTDAQQEQARANIGAGSEVDVADLKSQMNQDIQYGTYKSVFDYTYSVGNVTASNGTVVINDNTNYQHSSYIDIDGVNRLNRYLYVPTGYKALTRNFDKNDGTYTVTKNSNWMTAGTHQLDSADAPRYMIIIVVTDPTGTITPEMAAGVEFYKYNPTKNTTDINALDTRVTALETSDAGKLDKNQGSGNAGKALFVGSNGVVTPQEFSAIVTPSDIGMKPDKGYLNGTTNLSLNRSLLKQRVLFATALCGAGTTISITDITKVTTFEVRKYNPQTGVYVDTQGSIANNSSSVTLTDDYLIAIYCNTSYEDVGDYYSALNGSIGIAYNQPSISYAELPSMFEFGTLDNNGQPSGTSNTRLRTSDYMTVGKGTLIILDDTSYYLNIAKYNNGGTRGFYGADNIVYGPAYLVPEDCVIKLVAAPTVAASFTAVGAIKPKIRYVEPQGEPLPGYYYADDYIQGRCAEINSHDDDCAYGGMMFAFITDEHWSTSSKRAPLLMEYIRAHTSIRDIVFNGDAFTNFDTKDEAKAAYDEVRDFFGSFDGHHWYPVVGNHELNNPGASSSLLEKTLSDAEAYGLVVKEQEQIIIVIDALSYYVDNANTKIRSIFVGCTYTSQIPSATSTAVAAVIAATPADYKIIVFSHIGITGTGSTGEIDSTFQPILTELDAVQSKVICAITGHRHADGAVVTTAGVNVIATTCDTRNDQVLTRTNGTITEGAFDIVQIDTTNKKIYMTRIGAGEDREFDY